MKGITVDDAGVLDYVGTYSITINMYGNEVKVDDEEYLIIRQSDILAVL